MIRRIYGALPPDYPSDNVIVGRINAYYRAYGTGYDFCTFYEGEKGDNMLALYYGSELYVHCNENGDLQNIITFFGNARCKSRNVGYQAVGRIRNALYNDIGTNACRV